MMTSRIKAAMEERGMSQAEVAAATGIAPTQLARMLRDPDHNYTMRTLQRIASALGADLSVEFADPDPPLADGGEFSDGAYARLLTENEARASFGWTPIKITKTVINTIFGDTVIDGVVGFDITTSKETPET